MANPVTTGTTYAGEFSGKYISAALLSGSTLANGGLTVMPNVKFKSVIQKAALGSIVADAGCDYSASGTLTLTERIIEPKELQVNYTLCKKDLHATWQAAQMGFGAFDQLPASFEDYVIAYTADKVAADIETSIWTGNGATGGQFTGFTKLLTDDADLPTGQEIAQVSGGVTASNVVAELGKVVDAVPNAVYGKEDLTIYISTKIAKAYISAQAALGYRDQYNVGQTEMNFQGIPLFVAPGLGDDDMIAAEKSNLFFGTGLVSDQNLVKVIDTADILGDQNVRIIMRFTAGVQIGNITDVVSYGIPNANN